MAFSPHESSPAPDVTALHDVLFTELGADWTPNTTQEAECLEQYKELREAARTTRQYWTDLYRKRADRPSRDAAHEALAIAEQRCLAPLYSIFHGQNRSALCLSGGGIRSATFALGVLHAMAKYSYKGEPGSEPGRLLADFDYLSTVSGGGYIGSWLSSWIAREGSSEPVIRQLASTPTDKLDPEPNPLRYLREYSNYLNPRLGVFSADTWTLLATALQNILLNWLVLIPFFAAALLLPELFRRLLLIDPTVMSRYTGFLLGLGFSAGVIGTSFITYNLPSFGDGKNGERRFLTYCLLPLTISAISLTLWWAWQPQTDISQMSGKYFALFGASMHSMGVIGGVILSLGFRSTNFRTGHFRPARLTTAFVAAIVTGALGAWLFSSLAASLHPALNGDAIYAVLGIPIVFLILACVGVLSVGVSSKITGDDDREWWARAGGWVVAVALTWLVFSSLVLLVPNAVASLDRRWSLTFSSASAVLGWIVSRAGASERTGSDSRGDRSAKKKNPLNETVDRLILPAGAILFLIALACSLVFLNAWIEDVFGIRGPLLMLFEVGLAVLMSYGVNVNKFSLHAMYRMRLVRAYLGASHTDRKSNPFTGFDIRDNLRMSELSAKKPLHVLNVCLNLVRGTKLAWQQRKAEPFTITRFHSGSFRLGYQPSATYGSGNTRDGISLGTAMTISGAAASPSQGYHSSPLTALIMTLFNARLGWWLANPGEPGRGFWDKSGPAFGIRPILDEALGNTTDANRYVYLSDGGHFENLGLFEMVLRRCRFIVVVDAGADPNYTKEDLGNAVRKIRIDLGVPIEFPEFPDGIPTDPSLGARARHCALGEILYDCVDPGAENGRLLYLKPVLTGDEPADVLNYNAANPAFPQQSTTDQWFDESQFESYRRLGAHTIEAILGPEIRSFGIAELFEQARAYLGLGSLEDISAGASKLTLWSAYLGLPPGSTRKLMDPTESSSW
ncbi:MAG: patatin-like phospholipase family protein [Bryobacteraceae bacterium]